jgi:hypothetical protein
VKPSLESIRYQEKNMTGFSNWWQVAEQKTENSHSRHQKGKKHLKTSE